MPNRLDLPPELASLIEKREQEDRRKQDLDAEAQSSGEATDGTTSSEERRAGTDRRASES